MLQIASWSLVFLSAFYSIYYSWSNEIKIKDAVFVLKLGLLATTFSIVFMYVISSVKALPESDLLSILAMKKLGFGGVVLPFSYSILIFGFCSVAISKFKEKKTKIN